MFTIEHDHDETVTTVLDNDGKHEDLQLIIGDKSVYIRQYNHGKKTYDLIEISPLMFQELLKNTVLILSHYRKCQMTSIMKALLF